MTASTARALALRSRAISNVQDLTAGLLRRRQNETGGPDFRSIAAKLNKLLM